MTIVPFNTIKNKLKNSFPLHEHQILRTAGLKKPMQYFQKKNR